MLQAKLLLRCCVVDDRVWTFSKDQGGSAHSDSTRRAWNKEKVEGVVVLKVSLCVFSLIHSYGDIRCAVGGLIANAGVRTLPFA